jgi:hypothetical protein
VEVSAGGHVPRVVVVGCESLTVEEGIGLSEPVAAAVAQGASIMIHRLLYSLLFAFVATVFVKALPELARYLTIRET